MLRVELLSLVFKSRVKIILFSTLLLICGKSSAFDQFAIITFDCSIQPISKTRAMMLYRGNVKSLNGVRVTLSDWPTDSLIRHSFYIKLLGKDPAQMNAYWAAMSFSGRARRPKEVRGNLSAAVINWLEMGDARIGYVPLDDIPPNANVLHVIK